ncbi:MAG: diguanylate cyclase [Desulfobacteraceae bacterium]|nr:diguanylate cyclase [Desulfobacteraceae bacterium]
MRIAALLKRSVTTFTALTRSENGEVGGCIEGFKRAVLANAAVEEMEQQLDALKAAIARKETTEPEPTPTTSSIWDKFRKPRGNSARQKANVAPQELQELFLGIISEFDHDTEEDYTGQVTRLRKEILASSQPEDILALRDDLLNIIRAYGRIVNEERSQISDFISEIGHGLMEVERQYLQSMSHSGQTQNENLSFSKVVETHLEEMKRSAQISTTLAEFKNLVVSRLASIRAALEEKNRTDARRQETLNEEMQALQQNLSRMKKEVDQVHERRKALEKEILIDPLTGVANKRGFRDRLKDELQRYTRYQHNFSMLLFDIDHFKSINDQFGHWAGDKCLKEIMKRIKPILRETDFVARWGGDEFVILFPGTDRESAAMVAERIRKSIENTRFIYRGQEISLTASIGLTEVQPADQSQEMLFNRVDKAMYKAKENGRNTVGLA